MDGEAGVMDVGLDLDTGSGAEPQEPGSAPESAAPPDPKEQASREAKEFRQWLRQQRDTQAKENPAVLKYVKMADGYIGRMEALKQLDPKGIDGVKETYSLIQAAGGPQAITEMQQRLSDYDQTDQLIAAGDPKAFDALGEDFNEGLAKLAPHYLDRLAKINPEAYADALLPHLISSLTSDRNPNGLIANFDRMVEAIQDTAYDDKTKLAHLDKYLRGISQWFQGQQQRAQQIKQTPTANPDQDKFQQERSEFEKQKSEHFWNTKVYPEVARHQQTSLERLFRPYQDRLKLDDAAKKEVFNDILRNLGEAAKADEDHMKQMNLYRASKNPDASAIATFSKRSIDKHLPAIVKARTEALYGRFLNAPRPGPRPGTQTRQAASSGPSAPRIVMTKPDPKDVDWKATKSANGGRDIYQHIYTLTGGRGRVQVRK